MAKISRDKRWISESDFPNGADQTMKITGYFPERSEKGKGWDHNIDVETPEGETRRMTIWGDVKNKLMDLFGDDPEKWIDCCFVMRIQRVNGKLNKQVLGKAE